jgi:hypothetical protein
MNIKGRPGWKPARLGGRQAENAFSEGARPPDQKGVAMI